MTDRSFTDFNVSTQKQAWKKEKKLNELVFNASDGNARFLS